MPTKTEILTQLQILTDEIRQLRVDIETMRQSLPPVVYSYISPAPYYPNMNPLFTTTPVTTKEG